MPRQQAPPVKPVKPMSDGICGQCGRVLCYSVEQGYRRAFFSLDEELSDAMKAHNERVKKYEAKAVDEAVDRTMSGTATFTAEPQWCRCHPTTGMTNTDKHCDRCGTSLKTVVSLSPDHCVKCGKRKEVVSLKCPRYSWWNSHHYWKLKTSPWG